MSLLVEPSVALFPPTYIFSSSKITAKIVNDSKKNVKFEWRKYSSKEEEDEVLSHCDVMSPDERDKFHSLLLFNSDEISIEPLNGEIWPKRFQQFIIKFGPKKPSSFHKTVYLFNKENGERTPFEINATCLQPTAQFSVGQIDIGHIPFEKGRTYQVDLINTGKASLEFQFEDVPSEKLKFDFEPKTGYLGVGQKIPVTIYFHANYIGQFHETFRYRFVGFDNAYAAITLAGKVMGASYQISTNYIDFGKVSCGYLYSEDFYISNTSEIALDFDISLKLDRSFDLREFSINPSSGRVPKFGKQRVTLEFMPITLQDYSVTLNIKGTKSEKQLGSIDVKASCICPNISILNNFIDLGNIFVNYEYTTSITLVNNTKLPGKFEFIDIEDQSSLLMDIKYPKNRGAVASRSTTTSTIKVLPKQLGHIEINRLVKILGSDYPPLPFTIKALCIGPKIVFPSPTIDFGGTPILQNAEKLFQIKNDSLIPARFSFEINDNSVFSIYPKTGEIEPNGILNLHIIANLDDSIIYKEKLTMNCKYVSPIIFEIKARGTGSSIVSSIDMRMINMGYVFTSQPAVVKFELTNHGRRNQELKWINQIPKIEGNNKATIKYTITPDNIVLGPKKTEEFQAVFESVSNCAFTVIPTCQASIGRQRYELFKPQFKGIFIKPMIVFSNDKLVFEYVHNIEKEEQLTGNIHSDQLISPSRALLMPITLSDTITNSSQLPLDVEVSCEKPFIISPNRFFIQPQQTIPFDVTFTTDFKKDFSTEIIERKATFNFRDNPHKYTIDLTGIMTFPNLSFSDLDIDFGTILKGNEESKTIQITNISTIPVKFFWELKNCDSYEIYPNSDILNPGEVKEAHISFCPNQNKEFDNIAICHVIGGPEYPIFLKGSAATIDYGIDKEKIDFGKCDYRDTLTDFITLANNSSVPISYRIKIPKEHGLQMFSIDPIKGELNENEQVKINIKIIPGFPKHFNTLLFVQVGSFDDIQINLRLDSYIPQLTFNIPHYSRENSHPSNHLIYAPTKALSLEDEKKFMIKQFIEINKKPKRSQQKLGNILTFRGVELSAYEIDFGQILLGNNKIIVCDVKNITPYPISFDLLTNSLNNSGFSLDSNSFRDIPPEQVVSLSFSFDSDQRISTDINGKVDLSIPLIFNDELCYSIHIIADITAPVLSFSSSSFVFPKTIIGQKWIQTLQIRNFNAVPVAFDFGECHQPNEATRQQNSKNTKNGNKKSLNSPFSVSPSSNVLPPFSFMNVDISFYPSYEKEYNMVFPVNTKYSDPAYIYVKGEGMQMKLLFDPPEINFSSIQPFSETSISTVNIINNSNNEMEVFSHQFDFQILYNTYKNKYKEIAPNETESALSHTSPNKNLISRFAIVVIIHGPPKSGKTTISNFISKFLNIPVLSLKDLFTNEILESSDEEMVEFLKRHFSNHIDDYMRGFIVDGLDMLNETNSNETEQFLMHFLKQKSTLDELSRNPYTTLSYPIITAYERALNLLTLALEGQYLFLVGLNANETACYQHSSIKQNEEKQTATKRMHDEMEKLFNMNEDEYSKLSKEEREIIDKKRAHFRNYKIDHDGDISEYEPPCKSEILEKIQVDSPSKSKSNVKKPYKNQISDPLLQSVILFQYTFGRLAEKIRHSTNNFQNLYFDPNDVVNEIQQKENDKTQKTQSPRQNEKKKKDENTFKSIANSNSFLVNAMGKIENIVNEVENFLPTFDKLQEKTFVIPEPCIILPEYSNIELMDFPEHFSILDNEPIIETPKSSPPKTQNRSRKSIVEQANNSSSLFSISTLMSEVDIAKYTRRWKLPPNSKTTVKLAFESESIGSFSNTLFFGISNCRNDIYQLPVRGICSYGDIDRSPKSVFSDISSKKTLKTKCSYILDTNEFYFGSLLIVKERTRNAQPAYKATFNLFNNSDHPIDVHSELQISGTKTAWALEKPSQKIKVGESGNVTVGFNPSTPDVYKNRLSIFIADNPEPFYIDLTGEGCVPTWEVSTTILDFDKLLLRMEKTLNFKITNVGKIPLYWKIKGGNVLGNNFKISELEGSLREQSSKSITINYSSEKAFSIKKALQIDFYDINKNKVYSSHHMTIVAESFDVLFDVIYPKGDYLDFGTTKIGQEKTLQCQLKNRGKYPSSFKIFLNKTFKNRSLLKISPDQGEVLPGDKPVVVEIKYKSDSSKKFNNCKAINLSIYDKINDKVTNTLVLPFSVETVYSSFTITPDNIVDFGPIPVSSSITKEISLKNTGPFSFEYEITPKIEIVSTPAITSLSKNGRGRKGSPKKPVQSPPGGKGKKKGSGKEFSIGYFHVNSSTGTINSQSENTINVTFNSQTDGIFENTIIIKVSDSMPKYSEGIPLKLMASAYSPGIITDDFEKVFPGQILGLRYDIMKKDTTVFLEDEQVFHFAPLILKHSSKVGVALVNPNPIPCTIDINLKPSQKSQQKIFPFEISTKSLVLNPKSKEIIDLVFNPLTQDFFKGTFEAIVKGSNSRSKTLRFGIEGSGTLPSVIIVDNNNRNKDITNSIKFNSNDNNKGKMQDENATGNIISFGKTLINTIKKKRITLKNNGIIPVKLHISYTTEFEKDFEIENSDNIKDLVLDVKSTYSVNINYQPRSTSKSELLLNIEVEDNPSSNILLKFNGEGFHQDIIFEGLNDDDENDLHFNCCVGQTQQATFYMRNVCNDPVRFQWPNNSDILFVPKTGHIYPGHRKKVNVIYHSEKPSKQNSIQINCQWAKIKYVDKHNEADDWDDSMTIERYVDQNTMKKYQVRPPTGDEKSKTTPRRFPGTAKAPLPSLGQVLSVQASEDQKTVKITQIRPEPPYKAIGGRQKDLHLNVNAVSDYIRYSLSTEELEFPTTMMFEKRTMDLIMTNTSQVKFDYNWISQTYRSISHPDASQVCPFSVEPQIGSIDAETSQTFKINFNPEEVDDFSATLICNIPNLTQLEPPRIHVMGRSKRPVCHFYLETSDYLSSGRRHPDYNDPLPDDIRVIEMFAYELKKSTTTKFGILNATDKPYEVTWQRLDVSNNGLDSSIFCDTPNALISSGRKHIAQFSYKPVSAKTVESLWLFSIPEYDIHIKFLIVGRMMPR